MNETRLRTIRDELKKKVEAKRRRDALKTPCECGQLPGVQYLDEQGLNIRTGRPYCPKCGRRLEAVGPPVTVIHGYGTDPAGPEDWPEDDE